MQADSAATTQQMQANSTAIIQTRPAAHTEGLQQGAGSLGCWVQLRRGGQLWKSNSRQPSSGKLGVSIPFDYRH